ncbi:MAG: tetratricopeptide repeat protein [Candidatus Gastranaerophilales bacterium]|nr:tetratricopeptide repeat protein [Candidatus Gastranaerophilales bacterium]
MNFNYKQMSDKAYFLHQKKKYMEAEKLYLHLLELNPDDSNILNLLGLLYITTKKEDKAVNYLTKAFVLKKTAYIASNLAKAYYFSNEFDSALKIFNEALSLEPNEDIYYSIALTYKKKDDYENAIENYKKALNYNPDNYKTYYNMSLAYKCKDDIDSAIIYAEKSAELCRKDQEIFTLLSGLYETKKMYSNAIEMLKIATSINPHNHLYFYNLGVLYSRIDKNSEAIIAYKTCILLKPDYVEAYVNISTLYKEKEIDTAISYLEKAYSLNPQEENVCLSLAQAYRTDYKNDKSISILEKYLLLNPNSSESYSLLATNYMDLCDYNKALEYSNKALELSPKNSDYLHGKAIALKYLGNVSDAKKILEKIVKHKDVSTQSLITLGMLYLSERNFEKGMELYKKRSLDSKFKDIFKNKIWSEDDDISEKTILLYSDCGLGDTLMYSRYIPLLKQKVKNLILQTDKELVDVLQDNFKDIIVISKTNKRPKFDVAMPIMDIQLALNLDFSLIPSTEGYLNAIENKSILNQNKKRIGLFWQGNKRIFKNRSISVDMLAPLFSIKNTEFYSFQVDNLVSDHKNIINLSKYINNYADTASLLKNIDVLITIDSSIVHMAGALGVKTYLLLPYTSEWRWFDDVDKCSWYDSVKIFKQVEPSNWEEVIARIKAELELL